MQYFIIHLNSLDHLKRQAISRQRAADACVICVELGPFVCVRTCVRVCRVGDIRTRAHKCEEMAKR